MSGEHLTDQDVVDMFDVTTKGVVALDVRMTKYVSEFASYIRMQNALIEQQARRIDILEARLGGVE